MYSMLFGLLWPMKFVIGGRGIFLVKSVESTNIDGVRGNALPENSTTLAYSTE